MRTAGALAVSTLLLVGCATSHTDSQRVSSSPAPGSVAAQRNQTAQQQAADRAACATYAKDKSHRAGETAKGAAVGGAIGALGGAAAGAAIGKVTDGDVGKSAGYGAAAGGVAGAATGGVVKNRSASRDYDAAFAQCMRGRGYTVTE